MLKLFIRSPLLREFKQCQLEYYKSAIKIMRQKFPRYPLLVCTDSPDKVIPILCELDDNIMIAPIAKNVSPKFSDFCTLYLAHAITIANSTYSWWAAYLNNKRLFIAPGPWWDPDGFIGSGMRLDGPYLHHPEWYICNADSGEIIKTPTKDYKYDEIAISRKYTNDTINLYRLIRGILL